MPATVRTRKPEPPLALNHPNIVTIHTIEDTDGFTFIVMEYVEGKTPKSLIEQGPMETSLLIDLGSQVADGLAAAHSARLHSQGHQALRIY